MFRRQRDINRAPATKNSSDCLYFCDKCEQGGWTSESESVLHERTFHREEIDVLVTLHRFFCLVCFKNHPNVKSLRSHYNEIHLLSSPTARRVEREIFICNKCKQLFFNKQMLEMHIFYRHMKPCKRYKFICPRCSKRTPRSSLVQHLMTHQMRSVSCCPICQIKCDNKELLLDHVGVTHKKHFLCNICGYETTREDHFNSHLDSYDSKPARRINYAAYFLKPRNKQMWSYSSLNSGLKGLELYNGIHICVLCRHICWSKSHAMKHIWRHHNFVEAKTEKKLHKCNCGEEFINAVLLKHHLFKVEVKEGHFDVKETTRI